MFVDDIASSPDPIPKLLRKLVETDDGSEVEFCRAIFDTAVLVTGMTKEDLPPS